LSGLTSLREAFNELGLALQIRASMALVALVCITINAVAGFTKNRSLSCPGCRASLATSYTSSQMTYDPRRLRRKGLIRRQPRSNTYLLTPDGIREAIFYTKVYERLRDHSPSIICAVPELRHALVIDINVVASIDRA